MAVHVKLWTVAMAWTDAVAAGVVTVLGRFFRARVIRLVEQPGGGVTLDVPRPQEGGGVPLRFDDSSFSRATFPNELMGGRIEIVLQSRRFLTRPLELPRRGRVSRGCRSRSGRSADALAP